MKRERLYYVDWLRIFVILTLVPFHAALTYTSIGNIYVKTPIKDIRVLPFLIIVAPLDNFFMTLLFFLSGMAAYYALQYRSKNEYRKERIKKLLVPLLLGTLLLCPVQAYTKALFNGFNEGFINFIPQFFSKKFVFYYGYSHLWFIFYLFIISLACLPKFMQWLSNRTKINKLTSSLCTGNRILRPIVFICIAELLLRPFSGAQTIIGDWANDVVYTSMFVYGFIFAYDVKIQERVQRLYKPSKYIFAASIPVYVYLYYMISTIGTEINIFGIFCVLLKGIFECSAIIVLLETSKKYLNKKSALLNYLNKASFSYYLVHLIPVSILTYCFINTKLNVYAKFILVVILSNVFIFALYELGIRRLLSYLYNRRSIFRAG